ncbi:UbiE Methylase involved in ubiquinone/menaquinone biosynthesis [Methylophilaceae bacterium]
MQTKENWEQVYQTKAPDTVSWFQVHAEHSLQFIHSTGVNHDGPIIDVGGGASTLVDDLLKEGYHSLSVLDISGAALNAAKKRLGVLKEKIQWIEADVTRVSLPEAYYDIWHDRAVFHFLILAEDRSAYIELVKRSVKSGGHVIIATFAEDGPSKCSGLPIVRYTANELQTELGASFILTRYEKKAHYTPLGNVQQFLYCCFTNVGGLIDAEL